MVVSIEINNKGHITDAWENIDKSYKYYAEKKGFTQEYILYDLIYMMLEWAKWSTIENFRIEVASRICRRDSLGRGMRKLSVLHTSPK